MATVTPSSLTLDQAARPIRGVYSITDPASGATYIGQSTNILKRWFDHRHNLEVGMHVYQEHFAVAWQADLLEFRILQVVPAPHSLRSAELAWIKSYWGTPEEGLLLNSELRPPRIDRVLPKPESPVVTVDVDLESDRFLGHVLGAEMGASEQNRDRLGELIFGAVRRTMDRSR